MASPGAPRASTESSRPINETSGGGRATAWWIEAFPLAYLGPALAVYSLFILWPLLRVFSLALERWNGYGPQTFVGFASFAALLVDPVFQSALAHTLLWMAGGALLLSLAGLLAALVVQASFVRALSLAILFFPALLPPAVVGAIWTLVYSPLSGMLNRLLRGVGLGGLALAWLGDSHLALPALFVAWAWSSLGVSCLVFAAGLASIGRESMELAIVEGAGTLQRLRYVTLPALRRSSLVSILVNGALALQVFDLVFVTTGGGPGYATLILPIDMYGRAFGGFSGVGEGAADGSIQVMLGLLLAAATFLLLLRDEGVNEGSDAWREPSRPVPTAITILLIAAVLLPVAWLTGVALGTPSGLVGTALPGWDPATWAWSNLATVWNAGMGGALATSALLAMTVVGLTLLVATPAAFILGRIRRRPLRGAVLALLVAGLFEPLPVVIIPLFFLLKSLGMLNTAAGVVLPEVARATPLAVLLLWVTFAQLSREVMQAAAIDGAAPLRQLWHIALPLARPALAAAAVWSFVVSWNEYLLPTIVSQDGSLQTVPMVLASFIGRYNTQYGLLGAGSLLAVLPALVIYLALRGPAAIALTRAERRVQ